MQEIPLSDIEKRVKGVIEKVLQVKDRDMTRETTIADLGGDSLAALGIISALEQEFDVDIPDEDAQAISSLGTAVDIVKKRLK